MALTTILAQVNPPALTLTNVYTVPATFRDALYVIVTNRTATPLTYRIAFAANGANDSPEQYVVYDSTVSTIPQATRRVALPAGTVIRVYAETSGLNFCVNGIEQS